MLGRPEREEVCCDFPDCPQNFDGTDGARVALVKNGKIIAFCSEHSALLLSKGKDLRTVASIHTELEEAKNGPERKRREAERQAKEQAFIDSL